MRPEHDRQAQPRTRPPPQLTRTTMHRSQRGQESGNWPSSGTPTYGTLTCSNLSSATLASGSVTGSSEPHTATRGPNRYGPRTPDARIPRSEGRGIRSDQLNNVAVAALGTLLAMTRGVV